MQSCRTGPHGGVRSNIGRVVLEVTDNTRNWGSVPTHYSEQSRVQGSSLLVTFPSVAQLDLELPLGTSSITCISAPDIAEIVGRTLQGLRYFHKSYVC